MEYSGVGEEIDAEGKKEEKTAQVPVGFILGTGWVIVVFSEIRGTGDVGLKGHRRCGFEGEMPTYPFGQVGLDLKLWRQGWAEEVNESSPR